MRVDRRNTVQFFEDSLRIDFGSVERSVHPRGAKAPSVLVAELIFFPEVILIVENFNLGPIGFVKPPTAAGVVPPIGRESNKVGGFVLGKPMEQTAASVMSRNPPDTRASTITSGQKSLDVDVEKCSLIIEANVKPGTTEFIIGASVPLYSILQFLVFEPVIGVGSVKQFFSGRRKLHPRRQVVEDYVQLAHQGRGAAFHIQRHVIF
jgi:hypothetical protein